MHNLPLQKEKVNKIIESIGIFTLIGIITGILTGITGSNGMRKIILNLNSYLELKVCCTIPLYNEIQGSDWFV